MAPIFYLVFAGFIYAAGQVTAPNPTVTLIKDGEVVQSESARSPIVVMADGNSVEIREPKAALSFHSLPKVAPADSMPFRRDGFGDWTVDCKGECDEGINKIEKGRNQ